MAAALPDLVDCERVAQEGAVFERTYELCALPRLEDLLAVPTGRVEARFAFVKLASGRAGAAVTVQATPELVCQRCLQGFALPVTGRSDVEFATADEPEADSEREFFRVGNGLVSLRELAEEELLLALPFAPACGTPGTCGRAPRLVAGEQRQDAADGMRRPFGVLHDLMKKT